MTAVIEYAVSLAAVLLSFMFFGAYFKDGVPLFKGYVYVTSAAAAFIAVLLGNAGVPPGLCLYDGYPPAVFQRKAL